jgi:hypothetical protein
MKGLYWRQKRSQSLTDQRQFYIAQEVINLSWNLPERAYKPEIKRQQEFLDKPNNSKAMVIS